MGPYSLGLEAAAHAGLVAGDEGRLNRSDTSCWDVGHFALEALCNTASLSLPFVEAARMALEPLTAGHKTDVSIANDGLDVGVDNAVKTWLWLDVRFGAYLAGNHVAARASAAMGAALIRAVTAGFTGDPSTGGIAPPAAAALAAIKRASGPAGGVGARPRGHLCVIFGAVVGCLGLSATRAARLFMYLTLRDTLSAATRLNLVGPLEAAAVLRRCSRTAEKMSLTAAMAATDAAAATDADAGKKLGERATPQNCDAGVPAAIAAVVSRAAATSPIVDILQGGHDSLYSRLFSS